MVFDSQQLTTLANIHGTSFYRRIKDIPSIAWRTIVRTREMFREIEYAGATKEAMAYPTRMPTD